MRRIVPILYAALFSVVTLMAGVSQLMAREGDTVIALFAPSSAAGDAFRAADQAGGLVLGFGERDWIVVMKGHDPGFPARVREAGAWLLLDPRNAAALCGVDWQILTKE